MNEQKQISAWSKAKDHPEFFQWLHNVTVMGYDQNVTIPTEHGEVIAFYFLERRTPLDAIYRYTTEFLPRWNALNQTKN